MLDPLNIRYILLAVKQNKTMTVSQTRKWLVNEAFYEIDDANKILLEAIFDGILEPVGGNQVLEKIKSTNILKDNIILNIKDLNISNYKIPDKDPYCYECHKPNSLHNCTNCSRTYHLDCQRKDIFVPNGTNNIKLKDHVPIETFLNDDSDMNSSSNKDHDENNRSITSTDPIIDDILLTINTSPNKLKEEESFESDKVDEKTDVLYVGQIREPNRKRAANNLNESCKNEMANADDENNDLNIEDEFLCTHCKFLKKSITLDPANITNEETCYLLQFVFTRVASWIPLDTFATIPKAKSFHTPGKDEINFYKKYCFKYPKTLDDVDQKIKNKEYKSFTEFYVDFLDIQHCIGIVYGAISEEYLATEYQMKDCNYELSEIRQCRDCYRRSNDKNYIKDWFCIPCVPRHELVYAKKTPWPYWPAKVIKFKDNKYDVRFFSDRHERAIIDAKYIKPIEVYNPQKQSSALRKAISELEKYQFYDQQPVGTFSFEKERVLNRTVTPMDIQNKNTEVKIKLKTRTTPRNKTTPKLVPTLSSSPITTVISNSNVIDNTNNNESQTPSGSSNGSQNNEKFNQTNNSNKKLTGNTKYYEVVKNLGRQIDKIANKKELKKIVMETMQVEIKNLKDKVKELKGEIVETKKKAWCKWCLLPATLYCCHNTAYCSLECQKCDWHDGHRNKCSHENNK